MWLFVDGSCAERRLLGSCQKIPTKNMLAMHSHQDVVPSSPAGSISIWGAAVYRLSKQSMGVNRIIKKNRDTGCVVGSRSN